jgi:hypothetical protein
MQVLATAPGGLADQFPKDMKRLYGAVRRLLGGSRGAHALSSPRKGGDPA